VSAFVHERQFIIERCHTNIAHKKIHDMKYFSLCGDGRGGALSVATKYGGNGNRESIKRLLLLSVGGSHQ